MVIRGRATVYCVRCTYCNPVAELPRPIVLDSATARENWIKRHTKKHSMPGVIFKWTEQREVALL